MARLRCARVQPILRIFFIEYIKLYVPDLQQCASLKKWQKCAKSLHPTDLEVWDGPVLLLQSRVLTQQLVQELVPSPHLQHTNNCSECAMSVSVPNICENPYQISHRMPRQMLCFICLSFVVTYSCTAIIQYNKILNIFYNWFL